MKIEITIPEGKKIFVVAGMDVATGRAWPKAYFVFGTDVEDARQNALKAFQADCFENVDEWDPEEMERADERFAEIRHELGKSWDVSEAEMKDLLPRVLKS